MEDRQFVKIKSLIAFFALACGVIGGLSSILAMWPIATVFFGFGNLAWFIYICTEDE